MTHLYRDSFRVLDKQGNKAHNKAFIVSCYTFIYEYFVSEAIKENIDYNSI